MAAFGVLILSASISLMEAYGLPFHSIGIFERRLLHQSIYRATLDFNGPSATDR
jgi:hypothetical protein